MHTLVEEITRQQVLIKVVFEMYLMEVETVADQLEIMYYLIFLKVVIIVVWADQVEGRLILDYVATDVGMTSFL
jgi:hypothetical protein